MFHMAIRGFASDYARIVIRALYFLRCTPQLLVESCHNMHDSQASSVHNYAKTEDAQMISGESPQLHAVCPVDTRNRQMLMRI